MNNPNLQPESLMRPFAITFLVLLLGPISGARAGFIVYETDYSNGSSGPIPNGSIPLFNPVNFGGARLTRVEIEYDIDGTAPRTLYAENLTDQPLGLYIALGNTSSLGTYGLTGGADVTLFAGQLPVEPIDTVLGPYEATGGSPYVLLRGKYEATDLVSFIGSGEYQFVGYHDFYIDFVNHSPAEVRAYLSPDWISRGTIRVTYTYSTPAPTGLVLICTALPFLLQFRRLSKWSST